MEFTHPAPRLLYPDVVKTHDLVSWIRASEFVRGMRGPQRDQLLGSAKTAVLKFVSEPGLSEVLGRDQRFPERLTLYGLTLTRKLRMLVSQPHADSAFELMPDVVQGKHHRMACPLELVFNGALVISAERYGPRCLERKFSGAPLYLFRRELQTALPLSKRNLKQAVDSIVNELLAAGEKITLMEFERAVSEREPLASSRALTSHWKAAPKSIKHHGRPKSAVDT